MSSGEPIIKRENVRLDSMNEDEDIRKYEFDTNTEYIETKQLDQRHFPSNIFGDEGGDPLSSIPALPLSSTSSLIFHFVSSTSRFLNAFAASADSKLEAVSRRITASEAQMALLEAKLASVPGLDNETIKISIEEEDC
mmetsp:Transcript_20021/g.29464  ORF Transcript_20021/g.29464 Transcript_20021/m.29464 type:complete len:138 (+) Transcript_20021:220-633(+)|eukprot:CAMPEP_0195512512 /NCGR_PEP_ID=MMETSP0794_2-20130614/4446_1 /TAXON_ID=515487 /ORGANISM="Stephanopyxis turris, Strain CCMP 815" /LENGTH=137 /DNA_ID=CAMNT_0040640313 /DNA_START=259 /DNA_END=672 /DNA_ORIENTATION=-